MPPPNTTPYSPPGPFTAVTLCAEIGPLAKATTMVAKTEKPFGQPKSAPLLNRSYIYHETAARPSGWTAVRLSLCVQAAPSREQHTINAPRFEPEPHGGIGVRLALDGGSVLAPDFADARARGRPEQMLAREARPQNGFRGLPAVPADVDGDAAARP